MLLWISIDNELVNEEHLQKMKIREAEEQCIPSVSYQLEQSSLRVLGGEAGPTRRAIHTLCRLTSRGGVQRKPRTNHMPRH